MGDGRELYFCFFYPRQIQKQKKPPCHLILFFTSISQYN